MKNLNKTPKINKIQKKNKDSIFTIWTYGASLTHGYSCGNDSSSWPVELEAINKKIKIVNFGFPGIYSDYSIKKLKYNLTANILKKPDTYIGSIENTEHEDYIFTNDNTIVSKEFQYIPGLYKLFDEGIVNCRDHVIRQAQAVKDKVVNALPLFIFL